MREPLRFMPTREDIHRRQAIAAGRTKDAAVICKMTTAKLMAEMGRPDLRDRVAL